MLRLPEVIEATGLSRPTIYRLERKGEFPKRRRLGVNSVGWVEEELAVWIRGRPTLATQPLCSSSPRFIDYEDTVSSGLHTTRHGPVLWTQKLHTVPAHNMGWI